VNPDRLKENFECGGFSLEPQEVEELKKLDKKLKIVDAYHFDKGGMSNYPIF